MKKTLRPYAIAGSGLAIFAALSEKIAPHIGASQTGLLTGVFCAEAAIVIALLIALRRHKRES